MGCGMAGMVESTGKYGATRIGGTGMRVLNVGGNRVQMPQQYQSWDKVLLDIDPAVEPDLLMDARDLGTLDAGQFDAVYCSHNLEHYHEHEVKVVLAGFHHVLTEDGFVDVRVPDVLAVMGQVNKQELDLDSTLYTSSVGPIRVCDVLWGYAVEIERSGQSWFDHKTGFSEITLMNALIMAGFPHILLGSAHYEIKALGFKRPPTDEQLSGLGVTYER